MSSRWRIPLLGAAAWCLGTALAVLSLPRGAAAHGGNFSPPPPPFPGRATPLENPRPHTPTLVNPGVGGPVVTPGGGGGAMKPGLVGRRKKQITPTYETSWRLWWRLNGERATPERRAARLLAGGVVTPSGKAPEALPETLQWVADRERFVHDRIVPFLLQALDPSQRVPDDVRASAAIALGKLAFEPAHVQVLVNWMLDADAPEVVRESAALATGLVRRTEENRQFSPLVLDTLRGSLLQVYDRYVAGKRVPVPKRTRYFALFALGLLGDQPFHADAQSKDGRLITSLLWERVVVPQHRGVDAPIALLTALGLQPPEGAPDGLLAQLEDLALGRKVRGRKVKDWVRAHALTALVRLGGIQGRSMVLRLLNDPKAGPALRLSATLAVGYVADQLSLPERRIAFRVVAGALGRDQELLAVGLQDLALGRLLAADARAGQGGGLFESAGAKLLLSRTQRNKWYIQGFSALGLALAAEPADRAGKPGKAYRAKAQDILLGVAQNRKTEATARAAAVLGLGLAKMEKARKSMIGLVRSPSVDVGLRGAAALGLAHLDAGDKEVADLLAALVTSDETKPDLRARAALALSAFGHPGAAAQLVTELEKSRRAWHVAAVTAALGRLGDLGAVEPLLTLAGNEDQPEVVRAMAVVALGILGDPEVQPSLLRLLEGTAYPARTNALEEVFTIL